MGKIEYKTYTLPHIVTSLGNAYVCMCECVHTFESMLRYQFQYKVYAMYDMTMTMRMMMMIRKWYKKQTAMISKVVLNDKPITNPKNSLLFLLFGFCVLASQK